jgi:hypothetical protein
MAVTFAGKVTSHQCRPAEGIKRHSREWVAQRMPSKEFACRLARLVPPLACNAGALSDDSLIRRREPRHDWNAAQADHATARLIT